jgi:head-tail adaptor
MPGLSSGFLNKRIRIERPVASASFKGAGSGSWGLVQDGVWANIQDMLPSRGEKLAEGINVTTRPARVRMRYREDVTTAMRFVLGAIVVDDVVDYSGARIMQITAGPAEIGTRDGIEFMVEEYSPAGNGA